MSLQSVRGTHDLLPEDQAKHNLIVEKARAVALRFGFHEMSTPIFEFSDVFKRTLGEASDIVNKEMYTFLDRGGDEITLRPEGTAGIARAFISEGLSQKAPLKLFYQGPMFRYERPQKGRLRQFHQLGAELLGPTAGPADVEIMALAYLILKELGVAEDCQLDLNSLGDEESRKNYVAALVKFLSGERSRLSPDSQRRLDLNPLRILDSKDENDQRILKNAPRLEEHLNESSTAILKGVTSSLKAMGIPFHVNPHLVRGLDYYTHVVFEFRTQKLGAQDAVLSGGRYDNLIKTMGGPATPGVGFAAGIERLALLSPQKVDFPRPIAIVPVHGSVEDEAFRLAFELREKGLSCEVHFSGNLSKRMKKAESQKCIAAVILGPDELARGEFTVKSLDRGDQQTVKKADLFSTLQGFH